jgi:hypothetical protein
VLVALVVQAWTGLVIVAVGWAVVELHRHLHRRAGERRAAMLPSGSSLSPSKGLVALVIGAVVILRDGLGRSIVTTLAAGLAVLVVALVAFGEVVIAGRFVPVLVALVVALSVAVWHRIARHGGQGTGAPDMALAAYVEAHSFPGDTVADFAASAAGAVSIEEARRITDAYVAGRAAERFDAYQRRSNAARAGHRQ